MTKSTQRSITTFAWLAILGGGAYYVYSNVLPRLGQTAGMAAGITPPASPAPTGDTASDNLISQMVKEMKNFKTSIFSYMTYLQGEYSQPGSTTGTNAIVNTPGPSQLF